MEKILLNVFIVLILALSLIYFSKEKKESGVVKEGYIEFKVTKIYLYIGWLSVLFGVLLGLIPLYHISEKEFYLFLLSFNTFGVIFLLIGVYLLRRYYYHSVLVNDFEMIIKKPAKNRKTILLREIDGFMLKPCKGEYEIKLKNGDVAYFNQMLKGIDNLLQKI